MRGSCVLALMVLVGALGPAGCVRDDRDPAPPLLIKLSSTAVGFTAVEGTGSTLSQDIAISHSGPGALDWTATETASWLSVTPAASAGDATVTVAADITGLDPGLYVEAITVSDPTAANSPQTLSVTLRVVEAVDTPASTGPTLQVVSFTLDKTNPSVPLPLLTFARDVDLSTVTSSSVTLQVTGSGAAVAYTASYVSSARQLTLTPTAPLSSGTQYTVTVTSSVQDTLGAALDQDDFTTGSQPFTQVFDTAMPMVRLKGHVPMTGVGDVWMDGNFVYVAGRSTGANGLYIVDATDLANPVVAKVLGSVGFVQDVKVANNVLYATKEPGGVMVFDVTNPYSPSLLTTINDSWVNDPHNTWVAGSLLFVASTGTTGDIEVYDVSTPSTPVHKSTITNANAGALIHDMTVFNNTVYGAFLNGGFTLANISTPTSPSTIVDHTYSGNFCHSAWPSASGKELFTTDEKAGGPLRIWDISTPTSPTQIASYTANANLSIHNAQVSGNLVFISFYQAGLRVLDVSTPSAPVEVGWFDTFPGQDATSGTFAGNWGVHRVGNRVAVSDMATGLYLFRFTP